MLRGVRRNRTELTTFVQNKIKKEGHLSARMEIAEKIGEYKKQNQVTTLQINRCDKIVNQRINMGTTMELGKEFLADFLRLIHKESIRKQAEIMNAITEKAG